MTLKVFQATGGIEKVCRVIGKSLYEDSVSSGKKVKVLSMYDDTGDVYGNNYFPAEIFKGYGERKWLFVLSAIWQARGSDTIILSHINLLVIGWVIKKIFPEKN